MSILKYAYVISVGLMLSGCASTSANVKSLININQVEPGMSKADVKRIMNEAVVVGYEIVDRSADKVNPITIKNPYREEVLLAGDKTYDVAYYLTFIKQPDGVITDDELTPFVFQGDKLVARGWYGLEKIRKN